MSADAASLPCPICLHTGVFDSALSLRDRLIAVSTNKILCPVCQEEVSGLDKLTIHLFSHVKLVPKNESQEKVDATLIKNKSKNDVISAKVQQKKSKGTSSKNKPIVASNMPVKFVKIYPKLPVISLNPVPIIDISCSQQLEESTLQTGNSIYISSSKPEALLSQTNTICNVCGLQFIDVNVLKMHRCLIHNIDENSNLNTTRYDCHLCPKNFKMRGSLMVHLRVAHFGFSSAENRSATSIDENLDNKTGSQIAIDQQATIERNDNKQWQCDVCRKCFTTKYFLKKHKRLHTGETPYACTQCNKTFTFQQSYHKHLLYHNDEKPHTCNHCGRAFKELSTLHNHQRIHTGEKPFSCETCGKCFRQRVSYLVHRRIHTGAMPYKCTACDKSFRYKVSQRTHKCQVQPPGTVVRQTGELVEKLKKKHGDSETITDDLTTVVSFPELSEANAELVRRGAELSLEDMESENFTFITEVFKDNEKNQLTGHESTEINNSTSCGANNELYTPNIDELIDSLPTVDKNIPSPSEILKNLCLSKDDDDIGQNIVTRNEKSEKHFDIFL